MLHSANGDDGGGSSNHFKVMKFYWLLEQCAFEQLGLFRRIVIVLGTISGGCLVLNTLYANRSITAIVITLNNQRILEHSDIVNELQASRESLAEHPRYPSPRLESPYTQ